MNSSITYIGYMPDNKATLVALTATL